MDFDRFIVNWDDAGALVANVREHGGLVVLVNGCFDIIHPGHVAKLHAMRELFNNAYVIVALDSDASVKQLKGRHRPYMDFDDRARVLIGLADVDAVVEHGVNPQTNLAALIRKLRPDVWGCRMEDVPEEEMRAAGDVGAYIVRSPRNGDWSSSDIGTMIVNDGRGLKP